MSITLELTPEEETRLRTAAAAEGKDLATYIRQRVFSTALNVPSDDDLAFLRAEGTAAVRAAQQSLGQQWIACVYRRDDGRIVRRLPDGREEFLASDENAR